MRSRVILAVFSFAVLFLAVKMYTDLRGYDHGLFAWGQRYIPGELPENWINLLGVHNRDLVLYNLPDGLWMLAMCGLLLAIWGTTAIASLVAWVAVALGAGLLLEILQYTGAVSGTFDWYDLYAYGLACMGVFVLFQFLNFVKWKSG